MSDRDPLEKREAAFFVTGDFASVPGDDTVSVDALDQEGASGRVWINI